MFMLQIRKVDTLAMLHVNVLRVLVVETVMLFFTVVYASDQDGASSCLHAKLGFESNGISVFDIPTNAVSGNTGVLFYLVSHDTSVDCFDNLKFKIRVTALESVHGI